MAVNDHSIPRIQNAYRTLTHLTRAVAGASAQVVLSGEQHTLRLVCDVDCFIDLGDDPTATASKVFLPAFTVDYLPAAHHAKLAAIRSVADGTLRITELT